MAARCKVRHAHIAAADSFCWSLSCQCARRSAARTVSEAQHSGGRGSTAPLDEGESWPGPGWTDCYAAQTSHSNVPGSGHRRAATPAEEQQLQQQTRHTYASTAIAALAFAFRFSLTASAFSSRSRTTAGLMRSMPSAISTRARSFSTSSTLAIRLL